VNPPVQKADRIAENKKGQLIEADVRTGPVHTYYPTSGYFGGGIHAGEWTPALPEDLCSTCNLDRSNKASRLGSVRHAMIRISVDRERDANLQVVGSWETALLISPKLLWVVNRNLSNIALEQMSGTCRPWC
jgi:hypothetical protein